ncbi:MAG TPA: peptide deformylase [Candidatus Paceibacterota bacterium]
MVEIIQDGNKLLQQKAESVPIEDIKSDKIQKIINDMRSAVAGQRDGVAIAAPQIGVSLRMFVVSDAMLQIADKQYRSAGKDLVFINPVITKTSKKKQEMEEGCLSVRWKYGMVKRSLQASIKAYNESGEMIERGASGLLAQVFQHEIDHLDGILFIDKAKNVQDIPPQDLEKIK